MVKKFNLILQEKIDLAENTQHFRFAVDAAEPFAYKAGQFISLHIERDGKDHRRNYSIANAPMNDDVIEIAMSYIPNGMASTLLYNLQPGDTLHASGPYGQFFLKDPEPPKRYILIGTGTGITPYRSMLQELETILKTTATKVVILQGVRTPQDLLYGGDFVEFAAKSSNATFKACYSRELPAQAQSYEVSGYVQEHLQDLTIDSESDIAYLCGNPNMVDEAFDKLQELGLDRKRIRREKYLSSK